MKEDDFLTLMQFALNMKKVLDEKIEQQDLWKTCDLELLQNKLATQLITLDLRLLNTDRVKRKLLHIANYCYFLYTRLKNKDDYIPVVNSNLLDDQRI